MKLLVDSDLFCKLGIANLLLPALSLLQSSLSECGRLPALPYMLRRGSLPKLYGAPACDALIGTANAMSVIPEPDITWLEKLTPLDAVDPGEAQLFAVASDLGLPVLSGDKRSLQAIKAINELVPVLRERVIVLEAILLALCDALGHSDVRNRIAPLVAVDRMIQVCFSDGNPDPRQGLLSYYQDLQREVAPLILWNPRAQS